MSEESVHTEMPQLRIHYEFIQGSHSQGGDLAGSIPPILPRGMLPARCMGKMYQRRCMGKAARHWASQELKKPLLQEPGTREKGPLWESGTAEATALKT